MSTLPPHRIRISPKARHVGLTFSLEGVVIVVPERFGRRRLEELMRVKQQWFDRTIRRLEQRRQKLLARPAATLPDRIALPAMDEEWSVEYVPTGVLYVRLSEEPGNRLVLAGNAASMATCILCLKKWLSRKARPCLVPWLARLARENSFRIGRTSVRVQKTRWGSCSRRGTISLNGKLLFFDRDVIEYVLIHELCHTVYMNHSQKFWKLVRQHVPDYVERRRKLRQAARHLPAWLGPGAAGAGEA